MNSPLKNTRKQAVGRRSFWDRWFRPWWGNRPCPVSVRRQGTVRLVLEELETRLAPALSTPTIGVVDSSGHYTGSPFAATALIYGTVNQGVPVTGTTLEGVGLTLTYYTGTNTGGMGSPTAPTGPGTYTVVASFPGSTDYTSASAQTTFTISAAIAPKNLLIYYGYPGLINGSNDVPATAAAQFAQYDYVVLGAGVEFTTFQDYGPTKSTIAQLTTTKVFGYIDLGVLKNSGNITTSMAQIETDIADWKTIGASGIFFDDFGYDFGTKRVWQNQAVDLAHAAGLPVIANAFVPADALGSQSDSTYNPGGVAPDLGSADFYLYESYQVQTGSLVSEATWQSKATALAGYQASLGIQVLAITTNDSTNTFTQAYFNYAWYSALLYGYAAVGWGEYNFSASTSVAPFRARPAVNPGTSFSGGVVNASPLYGRVTNLGEVTVNASTDTGSFTPPVTLSPASLSADTVNVAYSQTITASNGTGTRNLVVSNLQNAIPGLVVPAGGTNSLTLGGTPTATGTETFTLTATDALGGTANQTYTVTVNPVVNGVNLTSAAGTTLVNEQAVGNPSPGDAPSGTTFPVGFYTFAVQGVTPGGSTSATMTLPRGIQASSYYMYGPTPENTTAHWYNFTYDGTTGATLGTDSQGRQVITLHFVDGQRGDADLTANGLIQDPAAPGSTSPTLPATHFQVTPSTTTPTAGTPFSVTVTAQDTNNNTVTGYSGFVILTSTDTHANFLGSHYFVSSDAGVFTFSGSSVVQNTIGTQTLTAADGSISGPANVTVNGVGLYVTSLTPTPTGFTASFSKPVLNSGTNPLNLYDAASASYGLPDVTLVGQTVGTVRGSLILNPANDGLTFIKTGGGSTGLLAADTYTATFVSGANAFQDTSGSPLNGNGATPGNYVTTFTIAASSAVVVTIPDFARGPDAVDPINVPNTGNLGIPISLSNGTGVTDGSFVLSYDSSLLTITGNGIVNPSLANATLSITYSGSGASSLANITFHSPTPLAAGAVQLGGLTASVPANAAYKSKELLHFTRLSLNNGNITVTNDDAVHVVAFLGDTSGDGTYTSQDSSFLSRVSGHIDSGFAAYPVVDPVILGDINGDGNITGGDVTLLNRYLAGNPPVPQIPVYPGAPSNNPAGPDPTLSIPTTLQAGAGGTITVPVNIDDPRPAGSTGMTQALLGVQFDPTQFTVSASDIHLGSVPASGTGWVLQTRIDDATGQLGIILFSTTPISSTDGGSLVNIDFHVKAGATPAATPIALVATVNPNGQGVIHTMVDDNHGPFTLQFAATPAVNQPKIPVTTEPAAAPPPRSIGPVEPSSVVAARLPVAATDAIENAPAGFVADTADGNWTTGVGNYDTEGDQRHDVPASLTEWVASGLMRGDGLADDVIGPKIGASRWPPLALLDMISLDELDSYFADAFTAPDGIATG